MNRTIAKSICKLFVASGVCLVSTVGFAQVQTSTSTEAGPATHQVTVERGTVASVNGNDLYVTMEDGTLRHFPNIPESARITVNGKKLGIHDLQPGMKLERTITTTSSPQTVTTVQSVTGKIWHVQAPSNVILTLEDGTNQSFNIPKGQKFNVDGKMVDAWGLKKGMTISATKVVETPVDVVTQTRSVTGEMPPAPPPPPATMPILVVVVRPVNTEVAQAAPEAPPQHLPKTGSELPLVGLLGVFFTGLSMSMRRFGRS